MLFAQRRNELHAVECREALIDDGELEADVRGKVLAYFPVRRALDQVTRGLQLSVQLLTHSGVVFNDENPQVNAPGAGVRFDPPPLSSPAGHPPTPALCDVTPHWAGVPTLQRALGRHFLLEQYGWLDSDQ